MIVRLWALARAAWEKIMAEVAADPVAPQVHPAPFFSPGECDDPTIDNPVIDETQFPKPKADER